MKARAKLARVIHAWIKRTTCGVGEAFITTNRLHDATGESAATKNLIHHKRRKEVWIFARDRAIADVDLALRNLFLHMKHARFEHTGRCRRSWHALTLWPRRKRLLEFREHRRDFKVAADSDDNIRRIEHLARKRSHVVFGDAANACFGGLTRFEVIRAIERDRPLAIENWFSVIVALLHVFKR